ncbi:MAG: transposase [Gemmatimonadetes bacterium]|nr:transposase [Gemmatimonadota bacterium]MYK65251.1 transposase [Gemmatimonadota bacterium]
MLDHLAREHEVRACYEASGAGYVLERMIRIWGHECGIVAPSLIPRRLGEQRKHDRKDAEELARLYRAGELVMIRVPTEREERVRDLVRCREAFQREALKVVYREGGNWTGKHFAWLRTIQRDGVLETEDQVVGEYLALLGYKLDRRDELDRQIDALALEPAYREAVGRLCCLKGISTQAAMVLVTEIGDVRRFGHPGKLMAYLGLVPRELAGLVWALMQESVAEIEAGRRAA